MFVVENTGQLMTLRWSRYHVTLAGVHRIAYVWKRAVRSTFLGCQLFALIASGGDEQTCPAEWRWIVPVKTRGWFP